MLNRKFVASGKRLQRLLPVAKMVQLDSKIVVRNCERGPMRGGIGCFIAGSNGKQISNTAKRLRSAPSTPRQRHDARTCRRLLQVVFL